MDKKQQTDSPAPFQDQVEVNLFFPGAQRRKLLDEVKKAIAEGAAVITITGEEGVGKTMICRMVEKELPPQTYSVYLPNTLESFDDVVRVLALEVGTANADKPVSSKELVDEITAELSTAQRRLVVLFDQAERMYLATIERIRKMLDRVNAEGIILQIVFAGRRSLLENLQQLTICNFEEVEERHFSLSPLGLSETYAYLNHCAQQRSTSRAKNVFTPEAAKKIYGMALGNLRMTNMLAAKSLQAADSEASFMVLLDNVDEEVGKSPPTAKKNVWRKPALPPLRWLVVAGLGCVLFAWLALFNGEEEQGRESGPVAERGVGQPAAVKEAPRGAEKQPGGRRGGEAESARTGVTGPGSAAGAGKAAKATAAAPAGARNSTPAVVSESASTEQEGATAPANDSQVPAASVAAPSSERERSGKGGDSSAGQATVAAASAAGEGESDKKQVSLSPLTVESDTGALQRAGQGGESSDQAASSKKPAPAAAPGEGAVVASRAVDSREEAQAVGVGPVGPEEEAGTMDSRPARPEEEAQAVAVRPVGPEEEAGTMDSRPARPEEDAQAVAVRPVGPEEEAGTMDSRPARPEEEAQAVAVRPVRPEEKGEVVELRPEMVEDEAEPEGEVEPPVVFVGMKKRLPPPQANEQGAKKIVKLAPAKVKIAVDGGVSTQNDPADQLFTALVESGESWLAGENRASYTVQLMVLSAEQAEQNLKRRLEQEEYRQVADNLHIVKGNSSRVYVFYGEYPDIASARSARDVLPEFLRKHAPYAVSIDEAIRKATAGP